MQKIKKLLILVIIVASFVIIYKLFKENETIKKEIQKKINNKIIEKEGFETNVQKEMNELRSSSEKKGLELTVKPIPDKYMDFPLREFMIKSSYNSAIINKTASKEAIEFVLTRGCRVLDFEIYTRKMDNGKDIEYISYSDDPEYRTIKTGLTLTFEDALKTVATNAFSPPSPCPTDPLFIQFRIKNHSNQAYSRISKLVDSILGKRLYGSTNGSTPIKNLIDKTIIILDALSAPNYYKLSECPSDDISCTPLISKIGMISGTVDLPKSPYGDYFDLTQTPIMVDPKTDKTDVRTFMMVTPDDVGGDIISFPNDNAQSRLPIQMLLVPFYRQNDDLKKYEDKFNECQSSFCAMGRFYRDSYKKNSESK